MAAEILGKVPEKGHLLLMMYDGALALPPGAQMMLVPDPKRADRAIPVILAKVTRETLVFRCGCGKPQCNRVLSYKLRVTGHHPPSPSEGG